MRIFIVIFVLLLSACGDTKISYSMIDESENRTSWQRTIKKQFKNAVSFYAHGNSLEGRWVARVRSGAVMPVEHIAKILRKEYPNRRIVLLICNPGKHELNISGVSYARQNVWAIPDMELTHSGFCITRELTHGCGAGELDEFIHNDWVE